MHRYTTRLACSRIALRGNWFFFSLFYVLITVTSIWSQHSPTPWSAIPDAQVMPHGAYRIQGQLYFNTAVEDSAMVKQFPWVSGLHFGLFDRGEFGVEYGSELSLVGKMQFFQETQWLPAFAFGTRQVFGSQEAHAYGVPDSLRHLWDGELYMVAGKRILNGTRILAGVSVVSGLDSGMASLFWGAQKKIGSALALNYEGFSRLKESHHNIGFSFHSEPILTICLGMTEIHRWFYQQDAFGFYPTARNGRDNAYGSPGVYLSLRLSGQMDETSHSTLETRVQKLEKKMDRIGDNQVQTLERLDRIEQSLSQITGLAADSAMWHERKASELLNSLVRLIESSSYSADSARLLQDNLLALGEPAARLLIRRVSSEQISNRHKEFAVRIMGNSRQERFVETLVQSIVSEDFGVRKEVVLALGKMKSPLALETLKKNHDPELQDLISRTLKQVNKEEPGAKKTSTQAAKEALAPKISVQKTSVEGLAAPANKIKKPLGNQKKLDPNQPDFGEKTLKEIKEKERTDQLRESLP